MKLKNGLFGVTMAFALAAGAGISAYCLNKQPTKAEATATAGTYTYDFVTNFSTYSANGWGWYGTKTISSTDIGTSLPLATVSFGNSIKQTTTITTMPVGKNGTSYFELTETGFEITSIRLYVAQWTTKIPSFNFSTTETGNDLSSANTLGLTSTHNDNGGDSGDIAVSASGITKIWFNNKSSNQVGYSKLVVTIAVPKVFGTLDHIALTTSDVKTEYQVGETFSSDGIVVKGYDGSDEATAAAQTIPAASLSFAKAGGTDLASYVFVTADISSAFVVTVTGTIGSVSKTATYNLVVEAASVSTLTLDDTTSFDAAATIDATPYSYKLDNGGNRYVLGYWYRGINN